MKRWLLVCVLACSDSPSSTPVLTPIVDASTPEDAAPEVDAGSVEDTGPAPLDCDSSAATRLRLMAANISSGSMQTYTEGSGIRIFKALVPDVVMIQEFNYGASSDSEIRDFVTMAFGASYTYARGPGGQIPNGVISRFPILASGSWIDPQVANRTFLWAKIDVPGSVDLWAVSVHFLTTGGSDRRAEAAALAKEIRAAVPAGNYLTIGGDFNTDSRTESLVSELEPLVSMQGPYPKDGMGNENTSAPRTKPYDWVVVNASLAGAAVPTVLAGQSFPHGLVFDTRVFTPLAALMPPLQGGESAAANMQHMPVVKDFALSCK